MHLPIQVENAVRHWRNQLSCHDPECRGPRRVWERISGGPGSLHVHGLRYCFPHCFEKELLRRFDEMRSRLEGKTRTPHRVPLGLLMLSRGDLDNSQLQKALAAQRQRGSGRIGEWLEKLGFAREEQITAALAAQWSCPVLKTVPALVPDCGVPFPLMQCFGMTPVHYISKTRVMHVAFGGRVDYRALLAIEQMLQCKAEPCITGSAALATVLEPLEQERCRRDHVFEDVHRNEEMVRIASSYAARLAAADVRMTACGEYAWVRLEAGSQSTNILFPRPAAPDNPRLAASPWQLAKTGRSTLLATGL